MPAARPPNVVVILADSARVWLKLALARRAGAPTESVAA